MSEVIPDDDFFSLENFRPSSMNQEQRGLIDAPRGSKYLGNQDSQSAAHQYDDCPDHLNHALWVMRIHRDAQLKEILDTVRTGGIFATHMSPAKNGHDSQAIKIVFMTHDAAAEYLRQIHTTGIYVRGKRVEGKWNRNGYIIPPQGQRTRVLHIRGPVHYMERHKWEAYMQMGLSIDLEEFRELPDPDPSKKTFEFRLGRVDGQAEAVFQMICKNLKMRRNVEVRYGPDPCDPNSGFR
ncbi:hypothetical protein M7I_0952 [Glarea lozoyensis 74030]|nr:hypothetical protein M7I_0952 [Glarea lozoyensis 74030]